MSSKDRVRPQITLTSPSGIEFNPKWQGNEHSKSKKLGQFSYPNNDGTRVQDLGIDGTVYPLTLHFDSEDHDLESKRFYDTCDERGPWTIIHPIDGPIALQLVSVSRNTQPVESATITVCETQWIEPLGATAQASSAQVASEVQADAVDTNIASADQFNFNIELEKFSETIANATAIDEIVAAAADALDTIQSVSNEISAQFNAIQRGITDTLDQVILAPLTLAGQVQQLVQLPALAVQDIQARLDSYGVLARSIFPSLPTGKSSDDKNTVNAFELGLSATVVATCQSVVTGPLANRAQAVEFALLVQGLLADVTEQLDNVQENFSENDIDTQYFSNSGAYNNLAIIVGRALKYLIDSLVSLKIEKKFTLDRPRSPIEITVTEYGDLGDNDFNYDFFLTTNALTGNDIRLLPAGREVKVYV